MSEQDFWEEIKPTFEAAGHMSRIESPHMTPGFPDLDYCIDGITGQVELKYGTEKRGPDIRTSQVVWFRKRLEAGGHPLILARLVLKKGPITCVYHGKQIFDLKETRKSKDWVPLAPLSFCGDLDPIVLVDWMRIPSMVPFTQRMTIQPHDHEQ